MPSSYIHIDGGRHATDKLTTDPPETPVFASNSVRPRAIAMVKPFKQACEGYGAPRADRLILPRFELPTASRLVTNVLPLPLISRSAPAAPDEKVPKIRTPA